MLKKWSNAIRIIYFSILCMQSNVSANTVVSIKPIGFIASAIVKELSDIEVIVPDGASPHDYVLKPSDVQKINTADLVIIIDPDFEPFLAKETSKMNSRNLLVLGRSVEIKSLLHKGDAHGGDHHHHDIDYHIWLSPKMANIIAALIYQKLVELLPQHEVKLTTNLAEFNAHLIKTDEESRKAILGVKDRGFVVFHDAYSYFIDYYNLIGLGHLTVNTSVSPGAKTLYEIRKRLRNNDFFCVFTEPQFSRDIVTKIVEGTEVKVKELDPLGIGINVSPTSYMTLLSTLTKQFLDCLAM